MPVAIDLIASLWAAAKCSALDAVRIFNNLVILSRASWVYAGFQRVIVMTTREFHRDEHKAVSAKPYRQSLSMRWLYGPSEVCSIPMVIHQVLYAKGFFADQGGSRARRRERTLVRDWCERAFQRRNAGKDRAESLRLYDQATKRTRWMPWRQKAMKDVEVCDKPRGADKRALIRGCPNGETRPLVVILT